MYVYVGGIKPIDTDRYVSRVVGCTNTQRAREEHRNLDENILHMHFVLLTRSKFTLLRRGVTFSY